MKHGEAWDLLSDYLDGALPAGQAREIEAHLADCEVCRRELAALRELVRQVAELPEEIAPARDLWPGIAERLSADRAARPRARWDERIAALFAWRGLWPSLAAGAAVIVIALALTLPGGPEPPQPARPATVADRPPATAAAIDPTLILTLEAECQQSDQELGHLLARAAEEEPSGGVLTGLLENLRTIERAIGELQAAWNANPESPRLVRMLAAAYRAKAALQGQATEVATRT